MASTLTPAQPLRKKAPVLGAYCAAGHALEEEAARKSLTCDDCDSIIDMGSLVFACSVCDFDRCVCCVGEKRSDRRHTSCDAKKSERDETFEVGPNRKASKPSPLAVQMAVEAQTPAVPSVLNAQKTSDETPSSAFDASVGDLRGKRKIVPTMVKIGSQYVKRQNLYDMDTGEHGAFELDHSYDDAFVPQARVLYRALLNSPPFSVSHHTSMCLLRPALPTAPCCAYRLYLL